MVTKDSRKKSKTFSKNLREIREIAITITGDKSIKVKYDAEAETASINLKTKTITLSLNPFPDWVVNQERLAQKLLDGLTAHECGHRIASLPVWERYNNFVTKIKRKRGYYKLAHHIVNIIEDKRVNHFIELRYRHDLGKRLQLSRLIVKDSLETAFNGKNPPKIEKQYGEAPLIVGALANEGLYDADCTYLYSKMTPKAVEATKRCLKLLENAKYKRLGMELVRHAQEIYAEIVEFLPKGAEQQLKMFWHMRTGGKIKGQISEALKKALEKAIAEELEKEKKDKLKEMLEDLLRGEGAGEGTGEEIDAPEPDFNEYQILVDKNKAEITRLLDKLKQLMKPIITREVFRNRGRIMPNLIAKAYTQSLRRMVKNVYLNFKTDFEKEKVAIGFLFDFSGSVDRSEALDITTILTEVFGAYVDDMGYSTSAFGANSQRVKTFFETHEQTKARVGAISVSPSGTELSVLLTAYLRMFNKVSPDRRKILVIASDFWLGDDQQAQDLIKLYPKSNVQLIFIGFCNCERVETWAKDVLPKNYAKRASIKQVSDLPEAFLDVYLGIQRH